MAVSDRAIVLTLGDLTIELTQDEVTEVLKELQAFVDSDSPDYFVLEFDTVRAQLTVDTVGLLIGRLERFMRVPNSADQEFDLEAWLSDHGLTEEQSNDARPSN